MTQAEKDYHTAAEGRGAVRRLQAVALALAEEDDDPRWMRAALAIDALYRMHDRGCQLAPDDPSASPMSVLVRLDPMRTKGAE